MKTLLKKHHACFEATKWVTGKTFEQAWTECPRGNWMLWLFARTNPNDLQLLTLAKGHCANTMRHLMTDQRSLDAIDAAIAFGEGHITREELDKAASAAAYAITTAAAYTTAAYAAATTAAYAAATAYATTAADPATYEQNQQLTADICRKYLPIEVWNIT